MIADEIDALAAKQTFHLPREMIADIRALSRVSHYYTPAVVASNWLVIIGCAAITLYWPHPLAGVAAIAVVATRQNALLVLMHEAVHGRMVPSKSWGDLISNWFCAYPFFVSTEAFRRDHLAHHSNVNTDDDPDLQRKLRRPSEWEFPKTKLELAALLLKDLCGRGLADFASNFIFKLSSFRAAGEASRARFSASLELACYYGLIAVCLTVSGLWLAFVFLWLVPFFTIVPILVRIRSIAEHFALPAETELNSTRNTLCPLWEQLVIAPHGINWHLDHHLFPSVPYYNLPLLHDVLLGVPEYQEMAAQANGYLGSSSQCVLQQVTPAVPRLLGKENET
ncbi:MAG: fatty acid desaturase family protein [Gemmataceae bacterium]